MNIVTVLLEIILELNMIMVIILLTRNVSLKVEKKKQDAQIQLMQEQIKEIQEKLNNK